MTQDLPPDQPAARFLYLVQRLLERNDFHFRIYGQTARDEGFDLIAVHRNERWAIEAKYYRTQRAQAALIETAAARLVNRGLAERVEKGMLIVSCTLPLPLREALSNKYHLTFVDRSDLLSWAAIYPELLDELEALLEVERSSPYESIARPWAEAIIGEPLPQESPQQDRRGSELRDQLRGVKRGRSSWPDYEKLCDRILRYLFPNDLEGWHTQKRTDDGLSRFDYICRIRPKTDYWQFLIDHLNTRYVLFEFKNYTGKIKQGQILTTEK